MSDECRTYVKQFSPYQGQTFWLHYVLGDIANQQHDYELWVGEKALMAEWPFNRSAIVRGYAQLVEDGFLEVVQKPAPGRKARHRFLFLEVKSNERNVTRGESRSDNVTRGELDVTRDAKRTLLIRTEKNSNNRDEIFDALIEVCEINVEAITKTARGPINRAVKDLRDVEATPDSIRQVAKAYRKKWPEALITPVAISKQYATFLTTESLTTAPRPVSEQACYSCEGTGWEEDEKYRTVLRCQTCGGKGVVTFAEAH